MFSRLKAALAAVVVVAAGVMSAATASAVPAEGQTDYRLQARSAGLTSAQAAHLDEQSDYYLTKLGGKRVSLNQIDVNGTATVSIALPGEKHPRDFAAISGARLPGPPCVEGSGAPYKYFCAFKNEYLTGDSIAMYKCGVKYGIPWSSVGSWENNQTPGTEPMMYYTNNGSERLPGAYSYRINGVFWVNITEIRACD